MIVAVNSPGPLTLRSAWTAAGRIGSGHAAIVAPDVPGVTPADVTSAAVPSAVVTSAAVTPAAVAGHGARRALRSAAVTPAAVSGHGARRAQPIVLAAIRSVQTDRPITIAEVTA
ncbi:MAG: hypothetical protein JF597_22630 [Streptomyces sp.]|uniref:hypothetical protein n=1 Tax=Streptomyces sp. TaxID=1931 RepID=UPI0025EAEDA5|nr:hypothetical protein [Streptomyces sp.]MBW8796289.1 hypothetical protein [Streptomyces sp.]